MFGWIFEQSNVGGPSSFQVKESLAYETFSSKEVCAMRKSLPSALSCVHMMENLSVGCLNHKQTHADKVVWLFARPSKHHSFLTL